jgi:hypothetical protein
MILVEPTSVLGVKAKAGGRVAVALKLMLFCIWDETVRVDPERPFSRHKVRTQKGFERLVFGIIDSAPVSKLLE